MIKSFEIYFQDLNKTAQQEILKFYEIQSPDQANLDTFPIAVVEIEKEDTKTGVREGNPIFSLPISN